MKVWLVKTRGLLRARPWVTAAIAVVLVAGGVCAWVFTGTSGGTSAATQVTTRLVSVTSGTVRESVSTTGTLAPADEHDVSFASTAEITSVRVAQGQRVTKGQVLGTIDPLSLQASLAQARATLANAQANLATAEDSSSTTSAQLTADKASVSTAKSAVTSAETALTGATLRSPITGTVATVNVAKGDQSSGSSSSTSGASSSGASGSAGGSNSGNSNSGNSNSGNSNSGNSNSGNSSGGTTSSSTSSTADFVIIGLKSWTVSATVDDTEVGLVAKGDQAQITTDNVSGTVFGVVSSVSVLSSGSSGSASYPVTIAVTGSPTGLHDGASATVSIIYKQLTNVLTVPSGAVHRDTSGSYVYLAKNGKQAKTTVKTGLSSGGTVQITSGLTSGQQVYVQSVASTGGGTGTGTGTGTGNRTRTGTGYGTGNGGFGGGANGGGFGGGNAPVGANAPGGNP